jgi:hypothetical protein
LEYDLDVDPDHLVEWLKQDIQAAGKKRFNVSASRTFVSEGGVDSGGENAEIAEIAAVGVLEVKPMPDSAGRWLLRVRVEDVIGPHLPEDGSVPDEPEELTLAGFEADFIAPDRGTAFVTLEVETGEDEKLFGEFFTDLQTDHHHS